jgi:tRNA(Ile)-lysidine synthase
MLETTFLLACSGGMDSMVLWALCRDADLHFEVAHCNFGLRGAESDRDADFVQEMGEKWNSKVHVKNFDTVSYSSINKQSLQESARVLRYAWFRELLAKQRLVYTLTAHQANDQLETFLINLIRGTGLEGLSGIPAKAEGIRRPFLPFERDEIHAYAQAQKIPWREDSSNTEDKYLRNRLRMSVIPDLKKADARVLGNFEKSLNFLKGSRDLVRNHISHLRADIFQQEGEMIRIPLHALNALNPVEAYLYELFQPYGFKDWKALQRLIDGVSGKEIRSGSHRLLRDRTDLLLRPVKTPRRALHTIYPKPETEDEDFPLRLRKVSQMEETGSNVLYVDLETLKEGLHVRKWEQGDYFYPLGMSGRQKIAKYFKDHKFTLYEKEDQWILCSGSAIVWLVGHRPDERFKITSKTKQILKLEWIG